MQRNVAFVSSFSYYIYLTHAVFILTWHFGESATVLLVTLTLAFAFC